VAAVGTPRELYESPPTPFVASFLGRSTTVRGALVGTSPPRVAVGGSEVTLPAATTDRAAGDTVICHVRPRDLVVRAGGADPSRSLRGTVMTVADAGRRYDVRVTVDDGEALVAECTDDPPSVGASVAVELPAGAVTVFGPDDGTWDAAVTARPEGGPSAERRG
jgi:putative spermidine/putrescine transport system ATP-binding protein/molybdate/tungstate transport system ATP-binding protein